MKNSLSKIDTRKALLLECAWEVCNQVGGIYTVIRSKLPAVTSRWGENYCLIGPYLSDNVMVEFAPIDDLSGPFGHAVKLMREMGFEVHYGRWLVTGRPRVILINPLSAFNTLYDIKGALWRDHKIPTPTGDHLVDQVVAFGHQVQILMGLLCQVNKGNKRIITHFHEWMAGTAIPEMRRQRLDLSIVFTTHATLLGRYLAMNRENFYDNLGYYDWVQESRNYNIESQVCIERAAAHGAHVFTTVSEVTARECSRLLGRDPDVILPNGLNIQRFTATHEFQNLHVKYKAKIHEFTEGHFFPTYSFDLDKTVYLFTSGRYEYKNKGFDLTLEALARLNYRMKEQGVDATVVMFFITKRPSSGVNPKLLQSRALFSKVKNTCEEIQKIVGDKLFQGAVSNQDMRLPNLNEFVDEYWRMRLKRTLQAWKTKDWPAVVTHNLYDADKDEILSFLRQSNLVNGPDDKVKIVYHPDFINTLSPLNQQDYDHFVRGCHLGVFPSYYEPWGYTPLECIACGIPTVTCDLSGFGDYVLKAMPDAPEKGIYVLKRMNHTFDEAAEQLTEDLLNFVKQNRRERIAQRNRVESLSSEFDWENLVRYYDQAYSLTAWRED